MQISTLPFLKSSSYSTSVTGFATFSNELSKIHYYDVTQLITIISSTDNPIR